MTFALVQGQEFNSNVVVHFPKLRSNTPRVKREFGQLTLHRSLCSLFLLFLPVGNGVVYMLFSRVRRSDQLYIDQFDSSYVSVNAESRTCVETRRPPRQSRPPPRGGGRAICANATFLPFSTDGCRSPRIIQKF